MNHDPLNLSSNYLGTNPSSITQSDTWNFAEPWLSKSVIGLSSYKIGVSVPISFTATVDADLSNNDKHFQRLSQIVDASQRTFPVSGQIETNTASKAILTYYAPKPVEPGDCVAPGQKVVPLSLENMHGWTRLLEITP